MVPRYARPAMVAIWEAEARYKIWFEIEAHATQKLGELGAILLAYVVAAEGHYLGIPYQIDLLVPAVLIWISVMEVTSILENLTLLNPDLDDTGFLQIFRRTDDTDDSEDTKHGN